MSNATGLERFSAAQSEETVYQVLESRIDDRAFCRKSPNHAPANIKLQIARDFIQERHDEFISNDAKKFSRRGLFLMYDQIVFIGPCQDT